MDAVFITDFGESEVRSIPEPEPAADEVLIEVERVQLSVTECNLYRGADIIHIDDIRERLAAGDHRLFGHEFSGRIVDAGPAVDRFDVGDRVYAPGKVPCGTCPYCGVGYPDLCVEKDSIGYDRPGALAEYFTTTPEPLAALPDAVSPAEGAAMQPMHNSMIAVTDADVHTGETVAVIGSGVMGYQCAQFAHHHGASRVFAVDVVPDKLEIAESRGLVPVDARTTDPVDAIMEATDGIGADLVFEAVGGDYDHGTIGDSPLAQAFDMVRIGGRIVQIGHIVGDVPITPRLMRSKAVSWMNPPTGMYSLGPGAHSGDVAPRMVARGIASIEEYVTHELDGLEAFDELVDITLNKDDHGALGPAQIVVSA